jgi:nicotinic acid mononucleotide adenylyltransferase
MVERAIRDYPSFQASDLEVRRSGKSFSVDTLEILQRQDPAGERFFIVGLDSYRDIASWKDYARLFSLCHLVVTTRPGVALKIRSPPCPLPSVGTSATIAMQVKFYTNQAITCFFYQEPTLISPRPRSAND